MTWPIELRSLAKYWIWIPAWLNSFCSPTNASDPKLSRRIMSFADHLYRNHGYFVRNFKCFQILKVKSEDLSFSHQLTDLRPSYRRHPVFPKTVKDEDVGASECFSERPYTQANTYDLPPRGHRDKHFKVINIHGLSTVKMQIPKNMEGLSWGSTH